MGYHFSEFVGTIDKEFFCSICKMIYKHPVVTSCRHIFCYECIMKIILQNGSCPIDGIKLTKNDMAIPRSFCLLLLHKLHKKCDFYSLGCKEVIRLLNLNLHHSICKYKPITKSYQQSCHIESVESGANKESTSSLHSPSLYSLLQKNDMKKNPEISGRHVHSVHQLEPGLNGQRLVRPLDVGVSCQQLRVRTHNQNLNHKIRAYNRSLNHQITTRTDNLKHQLTTPNNELSHLLLIRNSNVDMLPKILREEDSPLKWHTLYNIKTSIDQPYIFTVNNLSTFGLAQSFYSLKPEKYSFRVQMLHWGKCVVGLSDKHTNEVTGPVESSVAYFGNGKIFLGNCHKITALPLIVGDIIECGVMFPIINDENHCSEVFISINGYLIIQEKVTVPRDGFFPTFHMQGEVKLKYLME